MTDTLEADQSLLALGRELIQLPENELHRIATRAEPAELEVIEAAIAAAHAEVEATDRSERWGDDPVQWTQERLNAHLWSLQQEVMRSVATHRFTAVPSAFGTGKSFTAARLAAWWIDTHPTGEAIAISTAPTEDQVKFILWKEIANAHDAGKLPGRVLTKQWFVGRHLVAMGRKPSDYNIAAFTGIHALYVLVIIDEADGVAPVIWDGVDALATNRYARVLAIGNPLRSSGPFHEACKPGSGWNVIRISCFDTPNFTGEPVPEKVGLSLVSREWEARERRKAGPDPQRSPMYRARVLAQPPEDDPNGVIPYSRLQLCMAPFESTAERDAWWAETMAQTDVRVGIDVGADEDQESTVAWEWRGNRLARVKRLASADPEVTVGALTEFLRETGAKEACVDIIGVGHGIAGGLNANRKEKLHGAKIHRVNVGSKGSLPSVSSPGFPKLRDQIWWEAGRMPIIEGRYDLRVLTTMEDGEDVVRELIEPRWEPDAQGRVHVERKAETARRLGRSPHNADGILLGAHRPIRRMRFGGVSTMGHVRIAG